MYIVLYQSYDWGQVDFVEMRCLAKALECTFRGGAILHKLICQLCEEVFSLLIAIYCKSI